MGYSPIAGLAGSTSTSKTINVGTPSPAGPGAASSAMWGITSTGLLGGAGAVANLASYWAESRMMRDYGDILRAEALLEAERVMEQGRQFKAEQKMGFIMSGVQGGGTPMQVLEDTSLKVQEEADAIRRRGEAERWLAYAKASQTRTTGITGFLSDLDNTIGNVSSLYSKASQSGIFSYSGAKVKISSSPSKAPRTSWFNRTPNAKSTGILLNKNAFAISKGIV